MKSKKVKTSKKVKKSKKELKPSNQKSVYASFSDLYSKIMNDEVDVKKAHCAMNALNGMNRTFVLEIRNAEFKKLTQPKKAKVKIFEE